MNAPRPVLTLAVNDSDQVRDLISGAVRVNGADLHCMLHPVEEIFYRLTKFREWDVSEMSLGKYSALVGRGDDSIVGLPIFLSRSFRQSGIFVPQDGAVNAPETLAGARIGIPEWTVTATIYQRALLQHEWDIDLTGVQWVQGGINEPGRIETLPVDLPEGIQIRPERERSLNQLMLDGELDAMLVPHQPDGFADGSGRIVQLYSDTQRVEEDYFRRTGIFPIMHLVVVKAEVLAEQPWLGPNLVEAFTAAKDRSLARMTDYTAPHTPVPWAVDRALDARRLFGEDLWPYGLDANRTTLEAFLGYAFEQAITPRRLEPEELFPPSVRERFLI